MNKEKIIIVVLSIISVLEGIFIIKKKRDEKDLQDIISLSQKGEPEFGKSINEANKHFEDRVKTNQEKIREELFGILPEEFDDLYNMK